MAERKKAVLAYSGGLDTSIILRVLQEQGWDVVAYIANVGQQEDFAKAEERAHQIGATEVFVEDLCQEFVDDYIYPAIAGNAVYENRYLLGTSLARPIIAKRHVEIARKVGATAVGHGATGKGNDQVRFELAYAALGPELEIIAPWKDPEFLSRFEGRKDLLDYAEQQGIPIEASSEKSYSMDENLLHKSYEAGILEDPSEAPTEDMFDLTRSPMDAPDDPADMEIDFVDAIPRAVRLPGGEEVTGSLEILRALNRLAGEHGVGRIDMVENRYVGIKSRGVYETPGGTVLHFALRDLEGVAVDREVLDLRDTLAHRFARLIYNGYWFSPEMRVLRAALGEAARHVTGTAGVRLFKGGLSSRGRSSPLSLYDENQSSMDVGGGYDQTDAKGFIRLASLRLKADAKREEGTG